MYEVKLSTSPIAYARKLTLNGALAFITKRYHGRLDVRVEKNGVVVWRAEHK